MTQLAAAYDRSSYIVKADFVDELGAPVVPATIVWTLLDGNSEVVNNRLSVPITVMAQSVHIPIFGLDLVFRGTNVENKRFLVIEATYLSDLSGGTLPLKKTAEFSLTDVPYV